MAGSNNGRGGSKKKLVDQYKDTVPEHRRKDLDALVKKCNGDEEKITESIQAWWDEPTTTQEAEWEDVNKKNKKKLPESKGRTSSSRGPGRGRGRGGSTGGRGAGAERGRRGGRAGRGGRESRAEEVRKQEPKESSHQSTNDNPPEKDEPSHVGIPTPAVPPAPHGAWGQPVTPSVPETSPDPPPPARVEAQQLPPLDVSMDSSSQKTARKPARSSGNVWATKGSAHLIKAEKPPPPPQPTPVEPTPAPVPAPSSRRSQTARVPPPPSNESPVTSALESGLPASVNGANINAAGWKPAAETSHLDSLGSTMAQTIVKEPPSPSVSVQSVPKTESAAASSKPPPTNVLNMGHWETGDSDDIQNLDFGFGSFGTENETPSVGETTMSGSSAPNMNQNSVENVAKESSSQTASSGPPAVSPQRPPPGLSIAPPLPANAVLVSDLESKLESASLKATEPVPAAQSDQKPDMPRPAAPPGVHPQGGPILPGGQMNQNYNTAAYGMAAGMYNYNAPGNGFVGMHGAPVLAGGIPPKPQGGLAGSAPSSGPPNLPQGGLYGTPAPAGNETSTPSSENNNSSSNATAAPSSNSMPPGMQNAMPAYANPALFYGQHSYQMGQPHGVGGYGYGYGAAQFGGAVQGGFGYQQGMMGQSGAYPYDDQQQQSNNPGYQKNNSGGYRGRGAGSQYQNNYNPQAGGYAGQPYGMGYNGGYAPGNMDPYNMQQGASANFQSHTFQNEESHQKGGKRGGNGRNNGFQQQQHGQQLGGQQQQQQQQQPQQQQQSFGLQGGETNTNNNAGWSNQAGGWSGGPSWQGS
mmetsp:Transcript_10342/g.15204  ORF Transcript_10342/g.15204 Transcript_10342/m.15204 type:complete len:808 (+) Transcript_10342:158-2581(+)|eukprot:CAMPEP_0194214254 /NCGR_PEP_ID=MMETSP0156-20130528/15435_1 /TAXON_ID=33649 /ORGANISM="Thalassionema nitzschioides, Strain L26-B" /LENGTH=807 /DNA_ID=CAMNT_0038942483 /DNA_START=89 /DNA_END=2512 /DNA_ORIENTATION=+